MMMLGVLSIAASPEMGERLRQGTLLAVLDAFDRKIQRENFIDILGTALNLDGYAARLILLDNMHQLFKDKDLTPERFAEAQEGLIKLVDDARMKLYRHMQLVAACPAGDTPVH